ncbi:lgrC, partial [Symbiodinium natans]
MWVALEMEELHMMRIFPSPDVAGVVLLLIRFFRCSVAACKAHNCAPFIEEVADLFQTPTIRELMEPANVPTCLIPLRHPVKPRHLAFCLPGFGGNARALSEAAGATFAADVAIFGIQPKGMVNAALDPPLEDLGDMIQQTCSVVQQAVASVDFEPDSITLFGYSAGTLLALGVADALKDTVSKVVLIAPGSPTFLPADETPRKCDDLYQDLRYTSLVLSLFLAPQGLDVMAVAETVKSKEDLVEAVKKAGLSDQAVRPFLPYFEARYKSQK